MPTGYSIEALHAAAVADSDHTPDPIMVACDRRRRELGITIPQAAKDMGVHEGTIKAWGSGRRQPRIRTVRRYMTYLRMTLSYGFLSDQDEPEPGCEVVTDLPADSAAA